MKVLAIIPARGGSKGVPRKNIRLLHNRPLLAYTVDAALSAKRLSRVIVSTDDPEIADIAAQCGADVPFVRPSDLAKDDTPMLPVIRHAVNIIEQEGERYDAICLLQPTNPLRTSGDIDGAIELLERSGADAVVAVLPVPLEYNPHWVYFKGESGRLTLSTGEPSPISRRQDLPPAYHREGSVYVTRRDVLMEQNSIYGHTLVGYPMDPMRSVNIDNQDDWDRAERLIDAMTGKAN